MDAVLRVSRGGHLVLVAPVSQMYARSLALLSKVLAEHLAEHPQHSSVLLGRVVLTIEDALQSNHEAHQAWTSLYAAGHSVPVEVDVLGLTSDSSGGEHVGVGGAGGCGAWPGGGGGGGGNGSDTPGAGGNGADGALALLLFDKEGGIVDVDVFVTAGSSDWVCQAGIDSAKAILIGGGGGGGSGVSYDSRSAALYRVRSPYAVQYVFPTGTEI